MGTSGDPRKRSDGLDAADGAVERHRRRRLKAIDGGLGRKSDRHRGEGFARFFGGHDDDEDRAPETGGRVASTAPLLAGEEVSPHEVHPGTGPLSALGAAPGPLAAGPQLGEGARRVLDAARSEPSVNTAPTAQPIIHTEDEFAAQRAAAHPAPQQGVPQTASQQPTVHHPASAMSAASGTAVARPMTRRERRRLELEQQHRLEAEQASAGGAQPVTPARPVEPTVPGWTRPGQQAAPVPSAGSARPADGMFAAAGSAPGGGRPGAPSRPKREPMALPQMTEAQKLAEKLGLPTVDLSEYPVDTDAVALMPENLCRRDHLLPIGRMGEKLIVAMADPRNVVAIDDVTARTGMKVMLMVADEQAISRAIDRYHRLDSEMAELSTVIASEATDRLSTAGSMVDDDVDDDEDAPIIRFVNLLISQAIMDHASDIHIEPRRDGLVVRYRIDGVLHEVQHASPAMTAGVISRLKVMASLDIAERRKPQDGRISVSHAGRSVDLRVATLPTVWGEKVVMRILDTAIGTKTLDDLAMSARNLEVFRDSFTKPHGMVLVTGPTGSGKSTTLYTALGAVARPEVNVITVEDPVEFRMDGINQVQVNVKAGLTFAGALRSILRSDPDIVLIGEIRDRETAQIAIEASLTGHLVLSTLHTNNAPSAITRLVEMGVEPFLVGSAMECVVAQRLARRLCTKCAEPYEPTDDELAQLRFPQTAQRPTFYQAVGCHSCSNTGYSGRVAIHEVMHVDDRIERMAVTDAAVGDIAEYAVSQGMVTLRQDGLMKAAQGLTTVDEVLRVTA